MSTRNYRLDIDGPLFRKQRAWFLGRLTRLHGEISDEKMELAEGLVNLLDSIADQAHDDHGIDCLLADD